MARMSGSPPRIPRWFLILALLILTPPLVQWSLNAGPVRALIQRELAQATGIEIARFRIHLLPRPHVRLSDVVVQAPAQSEPDFRARRVDLVLDLAPLFRRTLSVAEVRMIAPQVRIRRDAQGRWHMPLSSVLAPSGETTHGATDRVPLRAPRIAIVEGEALVVDELGRQVPDTIRVFGLHLTVIDRDRGRAADIGLSGSIDGKGGPASFSVTGSIRVPDHRDGGGAGDDAVMPIPALFSGQVDIRGLETRGWRRRLGLAALTDRSGQVDLTAHVAIAPGRAGYDVMFSQAEVRLGWIALRGEGAVQGLGADQPRYAVTLGSTPFAFASLVEHVPILWVDPRVQAFLVEREGAGTLEVVSATVQGLIGAPELDEWKGVAKLTDGHVLLGDDRVPIDGMAGTVFFTPDTIETTDVRGTVGPIRLTHGKVSLSHVQVAPTLDLDASGEVEAAELLDRLRGMDERAGHRHLLQSIAQAQGHLRLSVVLTGQVAPERRVGLVKAEIVGHDLRIRTTRWPETLEHGTIELEIRPTMMEIRQARARIGPALVAAAGAVYFDPRPAFDHVTVRLDVDGDELAQVLGPPEREDRSWTLHGPLRASATLDGPFQAPRFAGAVELDRAAIDIVSLIQKRSGVQAAVEFAGAYSSARGLRFSQVDLRLPFVRLKGRGAVRLDEPRTFTMHLDVGPVSVARLSDAFLIAPVTKGVVQAVLDADGRWTEWASTRLTGWGEISHGRMHLDSLRDDVRAVTGRVHLTGEDALIQRLAFKLGKSDVRIRGTVKRWRREPDLLLMVESSNLDLSRLVSGDGAPQPDEPTLERLRRWAHAMHADVSVMVSQARYQRLVFQEVSGRLRVGDGRIEVLRVSGDTKEGTLGGACAWDFGSPSQGRFSGEFRIDGLPVHQVLSLFREDEILTGRLSVSGRLESRLEPAGSFWRRLSLLEPLTLRLEKGNVVHGSVLPRVLKILNVPALLKGKVDLDAEGLPFDEVSATVSMQEGVLASNDLVFKSPVVKVSGAGTYDAVADRLDLALAVSPLGAYSDLIGSIPLFGQLLAGDRPGLTTALFEVRGAWADPEVTYLPIESFAKGLTGFPRLAIDVLANLVALPQTLTTPGPR